MTAAVHPLANLPTARVIACKSSGDAVRISARGVTVEVGLPPSGTETRMRPTEMLMSAVAGCMLGALVEAANGAGKDWSSAQIVVTNTDALDPPRIDSLLIQVVLAEVQDDDRDLIQKALTANSRMFNTISNGVKVSVAVSERVQS